MTLSVSKQVEAGILLAALLTAGLGLAVTVYMWRGGVPPVVRGLGIGMVLLVVVLFFVPGLFLGYRLSPDALVIKTALGQRTIHKSDIVSAEVTDFRLGMRLFGTGAVAYNVGTFRVDPVGQAEVLTGRSRGQGVLLVLKGGDKVLVAPTRPDELVTALGVGT